MKKSRGQALVVTLAVTVMIGMLCIGVWEHTTTAWLRVAEYKLQIQAEAMARCGLRYSESMLAHRRWTAARSHFLSPNLARDATFEVSVRPSHGGWHIESIGRAGDHTCVMSEGPP